MNELRKLKRGVSTRRGDHLAGNGAGQDPFDEWEEQQRYWSSPRAPPVSPTGSPSPQTPSGGGQKKPVLGKVKSKAKKWMHLLHHKKKPAQADGAMWTPRAGPSYADDGDGDGGGREEEHAASKFFGTPGSSTQHPLSSDGSSEHASEVYVEASPRQNSPVPSPTARMEQPYFMVSSRFESEMKEANEMLRESKQLRVNTGKPAKTVTFAPIIEQSGLQTEKNKNNTWSSKEISEAASEIFRNAYATTYETALKIVSAIQATMAAYNIDRRHMMEKLVSVNRYLLLKLEPGEDERVLSEIITEGFLNLLDAWSECVERPLVQRTKDVFSWLVHARREESPPVPLSTHPCAYEEDAEEFYSLED